MIQYAPESKAITIETETRVLIRSKLQRPRLPGDLILQHASPGPEKEANWLPAPDGPFALALRMYWLGQDVRDGKWEPAAIKRV